MADVTEFQELEEEAPLLFKTYVLYLDAIFAFRFDICLNGKSQVPEEFYIGSNPEEEIACIPKPELRRLQDDLHHLHDEKLALTLALRCGWKNHAFPLKADIDVVKKLSKDTIILYFASHGKKGHQQYHYNTKLAFLNELKRQNLVVNDSCKVFLFIETPDEMLITLEFQDKLVQLDDLKKKYVEFLRELHGQVVLEDRVRLYRRPNWTSLEHGQPGRILNIHKMPRQSIAAVHQDQLQIFVKPLTIGKTITLDVSWCTTILELKMMIQDKMLITPELQFLTCNRNNFEDNRILGSYNIQKGDTIRVSSRLYGGGKRARASAHEEAIPKFIGVPQVKDL